MKKLAEKRAQYSYTGKKKNCLGKHNDPVIRIVSITTVILQLVELSNGHYLEELGISIYILLATAISFANE